MSIRIVTDSTCDLPDPVVAEHGITVVPLYINMDGESYLDGVDMSRDEFYTRLPDTNMPATTSAPGPGTFVDIYERLADEGATGIISIHISPTLSNVLNAATLAAEATAAVPVTVFDGGQVSIGTGFAVLAAAKAAAEGRSMTEILTLLQGYVKRLHVFAALDTVEFLRRSGRMSGFQSSVANILKIKPLLKMNDGVATSEKIRARKRAVARLIDLVAELGPLEELVLVHTRASDKVAELWEQAKEQLPGLETSVPEPFMVDVTPVLGAHLGPGVVGFACVTAGAE
jgi:DegV family protein with EDD domain